MPNAALILACTLGSAGLAAIGTWLALGYARRRAMLDLPGRRRNHTIPTPRGGGIGIVIAVLACLGAMTASQVLPLRESMVFGAGLILVAGVGWIDDHRSLSPWWRLLAHVIAAALWVWHLPQDATLFHLFLLVAAINFWNFMDGIDGLVVTQSAWVGLIAMSALAAMGFWFWALLAAVLVSACFGFLPFNFPKARIFLGDVGSGALGYACGAMLLLANSLEAMNLWMAAIVASALLLDAGYTLLARMLRGRRWYTAHREHLYQWMVRSGRSHARITMLYMAWNLILVLPLLWLASTGDALSSALAAGSCAVLGALVWVSGKRNAMRRVRTRTAY
jgi:UDP-N-acetylmuramyl pentapeptide phosphotransferase/UDP-N-acetylglucosamine-1-phosphate transferase